MKVLNVIELGHFKMVHFVCDFHLNKKKNAQETGNEGRGKKLLERENGIDTFF